MEGVVFSKIQKVKKIRANIIIATLLATYLLTMSHLNQEIIFKIY